MLGSATAAAAERNLHLGTCSPGDNRWTGRSVMAVNGPWQQHAPGLLEGKSRGWGQWRNGWWKKIQIGEAWCAETRWKKASRMKLCSPAALEISRETFIHFSSTKVLYFTLIRKRMGMIAWTLFERKLYIMPSVGTCARWIVIRSFTASYGRFRSVTSC